MGVPLASARHSLDEMTPLVSHPLRNLTPQQENLARKLAARKRPAALISQKKLTMIGGRQPGGISVCSSEAHDAQAEPAGSHVPKGRGLCCLVNSAAPKGPRTQHRAAGACTVQTSSRAGAGPWPKRLLQPGHGQCLAEAVRKTACVRVSVCLCVCVAVSLCLS